MNIKINKQTNEIDLLIGEGVGTPPFDTAFEPVSITGGAIMRPLSVSAIEELEHGVLPRMF